MECELQHPIQLAYRLEGYLTGLFIRLIINLLFLIDPYQFYKNAHTDIFCQEINQLMH